MHIYIIYICFYTTTLVQVHDTKHNANTLLAVLYTRYKNMLRDVHTIAARDLPIQYLCNSFSVHRKQKIKIVKTNHGTFFFLTRNTEETHRRNPRSTALCAYRVITAQELSVWPLINTLTYILKDIFSIR